MAVAQHARQRLMLTGTPLQNDLHVSFDDNLMGGWFKLVLLHVSFCGSLQYLYTIHLFENLRHTTVCKNQEYVG